MLLAKAQYMVAADSTPRTTACRHATPAGTGSGSAENLKMRVTAHPTIPPAST